MPQQIKRLISAFAIIIILFLIMQQVLKPSSFGEKGHYRSLAIGENMKKGLHYAGSESCTKCHEDIQTEKASGYHANVPCELCHGPALKHVMYADKFENGELPDSLLLHKPGERKDCSVCHRINAARIKILFDTIDNSVIKQIDPMKHNLVNKKTKVELTCIECHYPHQP
jgi:hypothetical protein